VACGVCPECRAGPPRDCSRRETIGLTRDGGFARQVRVPARSCVPLPENVDSEVGALAEPLAVALEAVLTAGTGVGDTVLVLGPGTIGQSV
ncbi:alcohol dehydrogenase catalytic domain-containing protein, partial [Salmonella enterica]|nr:alcohol dehydrogenase catalytic domain-containing protein [Salmonella enterica]